jgi:hypothetical protein
VTTNQTARCARQVKRVVNVVQRRGSAWRRSKTINNPMGMSLDHSDTRKPPKGNWTKLANASRNKGRCLAPTSQWVRKTVLRHEPNGHTNTESTDAHSPRGLIDTRASEKVRYQLRCGSFANPIVIGSRLERAQERQDPQSGIAARPLVHRVLQPPGKPSQSPRQFGAKFLTQV